MILILPILALYALACLYLPLARAVEMFGGLRGAWLALPVVTRLRVAFLFKRTNAK